MVASSPMRQKSKTFRVFPKGPRQWLDNDWVLSLSDLAPERLDQFTKVVLNI